jgi:uncharacterized damage-inducible protein DinB
MSTSGGTPSARAEELARQFEQLNDEVIAFVESCDAATWKGTCPGEERSVGAVAAHVADGHRAISGWLRAIAVGQPVNVTMDEIHAGNARAAAAAAGRSQADVAEALRRNGAIAAETVRGLSDDDLAHVTQFAVAGPMSAEAMITRVLLRHPRGHLESMRTSTADQQ